MSFLSQHLGVLVGIVSESTEWWRPECGHRPVGGVFTWSSFRATCPVSGSPGFGARDLKVNCWWAVVYLHLLALWTWAALLRVLEQVPVDCKTEPIVPSSRLVRSEGDKPERPNTVQTFCKYELFYSFMPEFFNVISIYSSLQSRYLKNLKLTSYNSSLFLVGQGKINFSLCFFWVFVD